MATGFSEVSVGFDAPWMQPTPDRRAQVIAQAQAAGLLGAKDRAIGGRVPSALLEAAKARAGAASDSDLLMYALSKVALEDDFGSALLAHKGRVPRDIVLDV